MIGDLMADERPDLSPARMATIKDKTLNAAFTSGFNEARAMKDLGVTIHVQLFFEGNLMNKREWTGTLEQNLPDVMAWVATHLLHGIDTKVVIEVTPTLDVPGTEIETVDAEIVEND